MPGALDSILEISRKIIQKDVLLLPEAVPIERVILDNSGLPPLSGTRLFLGNSV